MSSHALKPAHEMACEFAITANSFADSFIQHVAPESPDGDEQALARHRREVCAAFWAILIGTFEASALSPRECARLVPLIRQQMLAGWNKHCCGDATLLDEIPERATRYLQYLDRESLFETCLGVIRTLMDTLGRDSADALPVRSLAALIAHRMLVDLQRLNDMKLNFVID